MRVVTSFEISHIRLMLLYLDPGSGSLIIQIIIGALLAIGLTIRIFWSRIKAFFLRKKPDPESPNSGDTKTPEIDERN
jgi:hypothetical protein